MPLPRTVNLTHWILPIRQQGSRGTCVAFAMTALHEFYARRTGQPQDFSEQHLYYEVKQIDGVGGACGTWQAKAAEVLRTRGQCRESVWAYNRQPPCNQPAQHLNDARLDGLRFRLNPVRVGATDVAAIRTFLARGCVVTCSIPVYLSWYTASLTRRTGRITMPTNGDTVVGGHAMCLVGYDTVSAPGGGAFIVRNQWGTTWARESPYGHGYGTIPYAYIAGYNWEAYTVTLP